MKSRETFDRSCSNHAPTAVAVIWNRRLDPAELIPNLACWHERGAPLLDGRRLGSTTIIIRHMLLKARAITMI